MTQFSRIRRAAFLPSALVLGAAIPAVAQTPTIIPQPFVTAIAGVAAGSGNAFCTNGLPDSSGQYQGDGCLPTQATLANMYDLTVDPEGNIYISEENTTLGTSPNTYQSGSDIRVIYKGGTALTAALIAANPQIANFTPIPGRIYTLGGALTASISAYQSQYHCGQINTNNLIALDALGDGCPAGLTRISPKGITLDNDGNVIFVNATSKYGTRVIYVGGTKMAKLITLLNPTVVTPQVGYMYQLGFNGATGAEGDGTLAVNAGSISPRYLAVDSNENIYMSDGSAVSAGVAPAADNVRMINGTTGIVTTVAGSSNCGGAGYVTATGCPFGFAGDGGPATSALFNYPYTLFLDQYNNLFIADDVNARLRVLYRGGTLAGISNPVVGNIYTYAGGNATTGVQGTLQVDGTPAQQIKFANLTDAGIDHQGNVYILDSNTHYMWRIDAITGIGNIVAGGTGSTAGAKAGTYCNNGTSGPKSLDNFGDGCPGIETYISGGGTIAFDYSGNFYIASVGTYALGNLIVQEFSNNNQFPATAVGSSTTQYVAFSADAATTLTSRSFTIQNSPTSEYSDAGGTTCTAAITLSTKTVCVVNITFSPAHAGVRPGQIQFNTAAGNAGTQTLSGTGIASDIAIDNGTVSSIGTGLTPNGIATDLNGNIFVADSKGGQILKGASTGTTLTPVVTGLKNPSQVALDNAGNLYIADTGNNRILVTTPAGVTLGTITNGLSAPKGVIVDPTGIIYIADTGNNRIVQGAINGNVRLFPLPPYTPALSAPGELGLDPTGNLYILDYGNNRIDMYTPSTGIASLVALDAGVVPTSFAIDFAGDIYVTDATSKSVLDYYAGATPGFGLLVGLTTPVGIAVDADANIFVADTSLTGATELRRVLGNINFPMTNPASTTNADITVDNVGNAPLTFTTPLATITGTGAALFSVAPGTTNGCGAGTPFAAGSNCNFIGSFTPITTGNFTATATFNTNATDTHTAVAQLIGPATALPTSTKTTLTVLPAGGVFYSQPITLQAVLTETTVTTTPTGTFTLTIDGKTDEPPVSIGNGTVTFTIQLPVGTHALSVTYSGGSPYASSAASVSVPVQPAVTTTSLTITPQTVNGLAYLNFSSTVSATTATGQTGTVTIWAGPVGTGTIVCSSPISVTYSISCTTGTLTYPSNTFTAVYSGSTNGNFAPSQSAAITASTGDFVVAPVLSTFTIPQGGVGELNVNLVALYGSSGVVIPSCTNLPANAVCRFYPVAPALSSNETPVPVLVQVYTNLSSSLASNEQPNIARNIALAFGLPLGLSLLFLRRKAKLRGLAIILLAGSLAFGVSGCSGTQSLQTFSPLVTPVGTYSITIVFTGSNGLTAVHSTTASFTVLPAPQ